MANTIIQLKNSGIPGNVPSILQPGELAINYTDGKLFYGNSINVATLFDAITEPSGLNGEIQFNNSGVFGASANLKYNTSTKTLSTDNILALTDITGNKLISNNSSGDEGGEILLAKPVTNTTLDGVGITIDSYQNRIRFFEQGGSARGAYIDLTQAAGGVGTNLLDPAVDDFARLQSNAAFNTANSATTTAQAGFNHANGAFGTANSVTATAQAAFNTANTKYNSTGGEISGDVVITGNLTISGSQTIVRASNLATNDNMIYLNEARTTTVTNAVGNGTNVIYTTSTDHGYTTGMFIGVTGITPSSLNLGTSNTIIGVTSNTFTVASTVTDTYVSGGTARAKSAVNPDLGFSGGYYDGTYHHAGLFRDATDGTWKFFDNYVPEPDVSPYIDTDHASFRLAKLTANLVTDVISVRGVDPLDRANSAFNTANSATETAQAGFNTANSATTTAQAGFNHANGAFSAANTKFDSTGGTISGNIAVTGIVSINTHAVLESTTITTASISQTTLDAFATATYRSAKYLVQMTSGSAYHMIELSLIHDGTTVHLSQYGEVKTGSSLGSFDASISSGTLSVLFTPTNAITTVKAAATLLPV
jgi:hypothetical protein